MSLEEELHKKLVGSESQLGFAYRISIFVMTFASISVLVILRKNFGERKLYFPLLVLQFIAMNVIGFGLSGLSGKSLYLSTYAWVFLVFGIFHLFKINQRNKKGERWHSRYDGDIISFFRVLPFAKNEFNIRIWYEPLFVMFVGSMLVSIDAILGFLLIHAGFAMSVLARIEASAARNAYLDQLDSQIESDQMQATLDGKSPKNTEGFVVRGISDVPKKVREQRLKTLRASYK